MTFPTDYIWEYPGFYSLTVSYGRQNDFFYSGHLGMCFICSYYLFLHNINWMFALSVIILCLEAFILIVLRTHYCIDLIFGLLSAHYIVFIVERIAHWMDNPKKEATRNDNMDMLKGNKEVEQIYEMSYLQL